MLKHPIIACAGVLAAMIASGCGGGDASPTAPPPAAAPLSSRNPAVTAIPRATPADFRAPIARYRRHVRRELDAMMGDVRRLRAAVARGDLRDARAAWLAADMRYEAIGAAYGAFGELDRAVNGRPAGLPGGIRSQRFRGLHRVELALWGRSSTGDAAAPVARLAVDVARLRTRAATIAIDSFDYALRSHEVLEDSLHLQLSGEASPWSGSALTALRGNLRGTRFVLQTLRPLLVGRNAAVLRQCELALRRLAAVLRDVHGRWDALGQRDRERVAGVTAAATEQLAYVPEVIDPRPPRRLQDAFGRGS